MKAKEMFEALGYEQTTNSDKLIEYKDYSHGDGDFSYISFRLMYEEYEVGYYDGYQTKTLEAVGVSLKEHDAITKQMKELGWI